MDNHDKDKNTPGPGRTLTQEIMDLDRDMARLLARRSQLLARAAKSRHGKDIPLADVGQEKRLWKVWDEQAREHGLNIRLWKQMFVLANSMGYEQASRHEGTPAGFTLDPGKRPVDIDITGPCSDLHARAHVLLAAASGAAAEIGPVVLADPIIELCKGLNQAGARLSWERDRIISRGGRAPSLEGASIFVGHDPVNLFLFLALAVGSPGTCRLSGGPVLKLTDLSLVARQLPRLGARLASLDPHAPGLPVRVEAGGTMACDLALEPDTPAWLAMALALCAWSYPEGLTLSFDPGSPAARGIDAATDALTAWGLSHEQEPGRVRVAPRPSTRPPASPPEIPLPLDPVLCAHVLAVPLLADGRAMLRGTWPADYPLALEARGLLTAAGVELYPGPPDVQARRSPSAPTRLDLSTTREELAALAVVLGACAPDGARVALPGRRELLGEYAAVLEELGKTCDVSGETMDLAPGFAGEIPEAPVNAPGPEGVLALALLAFRRPGFSLANPGELAGLWPGFWNIYNGLPVVKGAFSREKPREEPPVPRKGRRIKAKE
jgi:chorismate mutase/5-enolpyruvylshikimate-3-phosphate synthase